MYNADWLPSDSNKKEQNGATVESHNDVLDVVSSAENYVHSAASGD